MYFRTLRDIFQLAAEIVLPRLMVCVLRSHLLVRCNIKGQEAVLVLLVSLGTSLEQSHGRVAYT